MKIEMKEKYGTGGFKRGDILGGKGEEQRREAEEKVVAGLLEGLDGQVRLVLGRELALTDQTLEMGRLLFEIRLGLNKIQPDLTESDDVVEVGGQLRRVGAAIAGKQREERPAGLREDGQKISQLQKPSEGQTPKCVSRASRIWAGGQEDGAGGWVGG